MDNSTFSIALRGVVPPICDAEAGEEGRSQYIVSQCERSTCSGAGSQPNAVGFDRAESAPTAAKHSFSVRHIRTVIVELCSAVRSALDDERSTAEESLRRAAEVLQQMGEAEPSPKEPVRGGLAPWQIRKVTSHVEAHLDGPIRNQDLATLARLNPCHFGRVFRNSFGEPPHEYVIRRRIERAQGLMLSTSASLTDIALDCGLADQSHLSRLFRRIVGETPATWRRARVSVE
jgi:AraC-like DNA-binding protein